MYNSDRAIRDAIADLIAFQTPWGARLGNQGLGKYPDIAQRLGVDPEIIRDAILKNKAFFAPVEPAERGKHAKTMQVPDVVYVQLKKVAAKMKIRVGEMIPSLLHAVMQLPREPGNRPTHCWPKLQGPAPKTHKERTDKNRWPRTHITIITSLGLREALLRRSAAYGVTYGRYIMLWLLEFLDGKLKDVPFVVAKYSQQFGDVNCYVLPRLADPEPVAEPSKKAG